MKTALDNQVHVWHTTLEEHIQHEASFQTWLSEEELTRAKSLALPLRQRFIVSRGILRRLLAGYSGQSPAKIALCSTPAGKPIFINRHHKPIEFNLSHSKNRVAFAFAENTPVGIDIEYKMQRKYFDKIAYRFFSAQEYEALIKSPQAQKINVFFDLWTRNEALVKALGQHLQTHSASNAANRKSRDLSVASEQCSVVSLSLHPEFAAALAIKGENKALIIKPYALMT